MSNIDEIVKLIDEIESSEDIARVLQVAIARKQQIIDSALESFTKQGLLLAKEHGVESVEELLKISKVAKNRPKRSRKEPPVHPPKYEDPKNPNSTYSGHGRRPDFVVDYLAADPNNTLEDLLIKK